MDNTEPSLNLKDYENLEEKYLSEYGLIQDSESLVNEIIEKLINKQSNATNSLDDNGNFATVPEIELSGKIIEEQNLLRSNLDKIMREAETLSNIAMRINKKLTNIDNQLQNNIDILSEPNNPNYEEFFSQTQEYNNGPQNTQGGNSTFVPTNIAPAMLKNKSDIISDLFP